MTTKQKKLIDNKNFSNNETKIVVSTFFDWVDMTLDKSCCNKKWAKNEVENTVKEMLKEDSEVAPEAWQKVINKTNWSEVGDWLKQNQK